MLGGADMDGSTKSLLRGQVHTVDYSLSCAHEQKANGGAVDRPTNCSFCDAHWPYQTIRSVSKEVSDLAIFVLITDNGHWHCFTSCCACVHRVIRSRSHTHNITIPRGEIVYSVQEFLERDLNVALITHNIITMFSTHTFQGYYSESIRVYRNLR